jgi:twin BRCT domain
VSFAHSRSELKTYLFVRYQDVFAKKTTADRGAIASTHLVCPAPEGSKYAAAVKWKLPAVTKDWLLKCAEMSCRVAEAPYLLTNNTRLSAMPSPAASVLSTSVASLHENSEVMSTQSLIIFLHTMMTATKVKIDSALIHVNILNLNLTNLLFLLLLNLFKIAHHRVSLKNGFSSVIFLSTSR